MIWRSHASLHAPRPLPTQVRPTTLAGDEVKHSDVNTSALLVELFKAEPKMLDIEYVMPGLKGEGMEEEEGRDGINFRSAVQRLIVVDAVQRSEHQIRGRRTARKRSTNQSIILKETTTSSRLSPLAHKRSERLSSALRPIPARHETQSLTHPTLLLVQHQHIIRVPDAQIVLHDASSLKPKPKNSLLLSSYGLPTKNLTVTL